MWEGRWAMREAQRFEPAGRLAQFMRLIADVDRETLAKVIERGIERLDQIDGDPDIEDDDPDRCAAGDDGCGSFVEPFTGRTVWGSNDDHDGLPWVSPALGYALAVANAA